MFNMSLGEMIMLGVIALIFIGPKELPQVARMVGRLLNELKQASDELTGSFVKTRDSFDKQIRDVEAKLKDVAIEPVKKTESNKVETSEKPKAGDSKKDTT